MAGQVPSAGSLNGPPGWALALHCGTRECEEEIKAATGATARCVPLDGPPESGPCIRCGLPSAYGTRVIFGRAY